MLAAIASFLTPGVGQPVQGRTLRGLVFFIVTAVIWVITFGFGGRIGHLWTCYEAAVWKGPKG
jgi:TM2 domain-containing membrane protein YozV